MQGLLYSDAPGFHDCYSVVSHTSGKIHHNSFDCMAQRLDLIEISPGKLVLRRKRIRDFGKLRLMAYPIDRSSLCQ